MIQMYRMLNPGFALVRFAPARFALTLAAAVAAACGSSNGSGPDAAARCDPPPATAPTYTELYTKYFAAGTKGHCANDGCHNGAFNVWRCGDDKDTCYRGMVTMAALISPSNPTASPIADPRNSPLSWINPSGIMPFDTPGAFPEGCAAITAWVAAGAQNN
jgi:hypothetical protein